jgi:son of sevenless-like protein
MMPLDEIILPDRKDASMGYSSRDRSLSNSSRRGFDDGLLGETVRSGGGTSKLEKIFGEVPAPLIQQPVVEDVPDFLRLDHENEIMYDMKVNPPQLRGGTLTGLVEQLTRHDRLDSDFNNTFLLTYRSFTTASELFELLVKRWGIQPPYGLSQDDYQTWVDKKQKPIQFRVVNILKNWFDTYWMEGNDDDAKRLMERVLTFAKEHVATTNTPGAAPLMTSVEQRLNGSGPATKRLVLTLTTTTPTPILPKSLKKIKFLDIDPVEFSRQLTIIESRLYGKIKPMECLNKTWGKKLNPGEADPAANIKALILHSNQLTNWVAQMILTQGDVRRRVVVIKHFVTIADVSWPPTFLL